MRFWDTSAIIPVLIAEPMTGAVMDELASDPAQVVWWGTAIECVSALARAERSGVAIEGALERLDSLASAWLRIDASDSVQRTATRLLRVHPLRAADALQLAAATVAAEGDPRTLPFVTFDERLATAASREGFGVVRPGAGGRVDRRPPS